MSNLGSPPRDIEPDELTPITTTIIPSLFMTDVISVDDNSSENEHEEKDISDIRTYTAPSQKWINPRKIIEFLWSLKWIIALGLIVQFGVMIVPLFSEPWREMSWQAWFSLEVTIITLVLLISNIYPPSLVFVAAMAVCYGVNIIDSEQALEGFSNTGVITVGVLFIVAKGIEKTNVLRFMVKYVLRSPKSLVIAQLRLMIPVAFLSAFINNTPIVAMMIPVVQNWSKQCGLKITRLLMPLSYSAILGGTCTIIGTSTNLIVQGLAYQEDPDMEIGFFEVGYVGLPVAVISMVYILVASPFLLSGEDPDDIEAVPTLVEGTGGNPNQRRLYTASLTILKGASIIGKTVEGAGLTTMSGITLFHISEMGKNSPIDLRDQSLDDVSSVDPDTVLKAGDTLFFSGMLRKMYTLYQIDGLVAATTQVAKIGGNRAERVLVEVVLSPHASYLGKAVRESKFRTRYNAVIIACNRFGTRIARKIGDIVLEAGDTLLLEATTDFIKYHQNDSDFCLVSELRRGESTTPQPVSFQMILAVTLAVIMILLSAFGIFDLLPGALWVSCLYVFFGIITWQEALDAVQGDTLLIIAAAFGLGNALNFSGAASVISNSLVSVFSLAGDIGVLFGLYASTALLSAVISNAATVTLMYPIAVGFAYSTGINLKCITFVLMLAASCSFSTPVGYQTNLMVMGPGGYTTLDFIKFGLPVTILDMLLSVTLSYFIWPSNGEYVVSHY